MGIHCDDDDSPTSARIMSSSSKYIHTQNLKIILQSTLKQQN